MNKQHIRISMEFIVLYTMVLALKTKTHIKTQYNTLQTQLSITTNTSHNNSLIIQIHPASLSSITLFIHHTIHLSHFSFITPFITLFIHSTQNSFITRITHSLSLTHSLTHSFIHSFIHSLTYATFDMQHAYIGVLRRALCRSDHG